MPTATSDITAKPVAVAHCHPGRPGGKTLADIQRYFNWLTDSDMAYKPFHNQFKKPALCDYVRTIALHLMNELTTCRLTVDAPLKRDFDQVVLHDGSSFALHDSLLASFPGRFRTVSPAAVEMHATWRLGSGLCDMTLTPDSEPERPYAPAPADQAPTLYLEDAGYNSTARLQAIHDSGHCFITPLAGSYNPVVTHVTTPDGHVQVCRSPRKLRSLRLSKQRATECWVRLGDRHYRVICHWVAHKKRFSCLITNLEAAHYTASTIAQLYRVRWQIELVFKEWKSWNNLKRFNTGSAHIAQTLIWRRFVRF